MTEPIRLALIEGNSLFRQCLAEILDREPDLAVCCSIAGTPADLEEVPASFPDLALLDLAAHSVDPEALIRDLRATFPEIRILMIGRQDQEEELLFCIEAGANGFVLRDASLDGLLEAVRTVAAGGAICPPRVTQTVFQRLAELSGSQRSAERLEGLRLTNRELEILRFVADNLTNKEIASQLHLSLYTVKNHVHNILDKLRVENRRGAVALAYRMRWLTERRVC